MRCRGEVELKSRANAQLEVALAETPRMRCNRGVNQPLLVALPGVAPESLLLRFLSSNTMGEVQFFIHLAVLNYWTFIPPSRPYPGRCPEALMRIPRVGEFFAPFMSRTG